MTSILQQTSPVHPAGPRRALRATHFPLGAADRFDQGVRIVGGLAMWAGMLVVSYWWIADRGVQDLLSLASGLAATGRLSGLFSAQLLLVQVLLMSRLPLLEQAYGRIRLAKIHRAVGLWSVWLMVTHIVMAVAGRASASLSGVLSALRKILTDYPGVLLAAGGTVCLIMVVATSVRSARRKLRYESWHLLHLYGYLGAAMALPHQLWAGDEFTSRPVATIYWWGLWGVTAVAVIIWRVLLPLAKTLRHRLRVFSVRWETHDVVSVTMTGRRLDRLPVRAGEFINVRFLTMPGWTRSNPFSLSAAPDGRTLRITARVVGDGTARLARLRPGTPVLFEGPYGRLSSRARTRSKVLLAGAGVGITPLRALAEGLNYLPGNAVLLQRYADEPLFDREFEWLKQNRGLRAYYLSGRRPHPWSVLGPLPAGLEELDALLAVVPDLAEYDVFLCGPDEWTKGMERLMSAGGVPADHVHAESFGW
ncbi:MAG: ferric reductase-like transmembrane domain-containing protein [Microlunatus sp.]|nr:ferric reductase-like transmembrane domain-containing protein [Microlunatus sp.]